MTTQTSNWDQKSKCNFIENRLRVFVGSTFQSDMVFHIKEDNLNIPAHSFIVGTVSLKLEKIVFGSKTSPGTKEIDVEKISANDFKEVIVQLTLIIYAVKVTYSKLIFCLGTLFHLYQHIKTYNRKCYFYNAYCQYI